MTGDLPFNSVSKPTVEHAISVRTESEESLDRLVLEHLARVTGETTLDDLAAEIAIDDRAPVGNTDSERSLRIRLHHVVLPRLQEAGFVRYDPMTHRIELGSNR